MDLKIKLEISNLVRKGIPEDVAFLTTVMKYKKEYLLTDYLEEKKQEQELLFNEFQNFGKFEIINEETKNN
jgi:hypothetical protein